MRWSSRAEALLVRLRDSLRKRGCDSVLNLARRFRQSAGRDGRLDRDEFKVGLRQVGVGASDEDVAELFRAIDTNGDGTVSLEEWLRVVRGPLSQQRLPVVREVFRRLDRNQDGFVSLDELERNFAAAHHPDVETGRKTKEEATQDMLEGLGDTNGDGRLSWDEFLAYYEGISAGVDVDQHFIYVVRAAWGMASNPNEIAARHKRNQQAGHIFTAHGGLIGAELERGSKLR